MIDFIISLILIFDMNSKKFEILSVDRLETYLESFSIDILHHSDDRLLNNALVYYLPNGNIVLLPAKLTGDGILIFDKDYYQEVIKSYNFPINDLKENDFANEIDNIKEISHKSIFYKEYLNKRLNLNFIQINNESIDEYYKSVLKLKVLQEISSKDFIALVTVLGTHYIQQYGGQWVLIKRYGDFNSYYEPRILQNDALIDISGPLYGRLSSDIRSLYGFFNFLPAHPVSLIDKANIIIPR